MLALKWTSKLYLKLALFALITLFPILSFSQPPSSDEGRPLNEPGRQQQLLNSDKPKVTLIFQPDCSWCEKQTKDLELILQRCKYLDVALMGTKGNRRQLQAEARKLTGLIPAYQASSGFLRRVGGVKATPITLFWDKESNLLAKRRAYLDKEKLAGAVSILTNNRC